jgi:hypothetical protein
MIPHRSFESSRFTRALHQEQSNRERGSESSSTTPIVFLLSDEGKGTTGGEASLGLALSDPLPNLSLSPLHSIVTPKILGARV